jgi:hypothetical protein
VASSGFRLGRVCHQGPHRRLCMLLLPLFRVLVLRLCIDSSWPTDRGDTNPIKNSTIVSILCIEMASLSTLRTWRSLSEIL